MITIGATEDREFTGLEAEAIALATNTFKSEHRKDPEFYGDLKHYTVFLELEVAKLMDRSRSQSAKTSQIHTEDEPDLAVGGSTVYGSEVHYSAFRSIG